MGERPFDIRDVTGNRAQQSQQPQLLPLGLPRPRGCSNPLIVGGGVCLACVLIFVLVLISLGSLEPTEYGLRYNRFTKQVDSQHVYRAGRHLIGPLSSFLVFPATVQSLEFSSRSHAQARPLSTRTAEGLNLTLHVAFQYHLKQ